MTASLCLYYHGHGCHTQHATINITFIQTLTGDCLSWLAAFQIWGGELLMQNITGKVLPTSNFPADWILWFSSVSLSTKRVRWGKLSHYMPWRSLGGKEVQLLIILDLGTTWGWVVSVMPQPRFIPGERTPGTHWIGGWVGPRAGLDTGGRRKILCPCRGSNPDQKSTLNISQPSSASSLLIHHSS
jgi:hypothetical protein